MPPTDHPDDHQKIRKEVGDSLENTFVVWHYFGDELPKRFYNFVKSRWMKSYRYNNDYLKLSDADAYFGAYSKYLDFRLVQPETVIRIATLGNDQDVALGFSVSRGTILDYIHVHKDCRRQGIARALMPTNIQWMTHLTKTGLKLWQKHLPDAKFNPFA